MKAKVRFILAAGVLGLLMTGPFALTALLLFADAKDAERAAFAQFLLPRLPRRDRPRLRKPGARWRRRSGQSGGPGRGQTRGSVRAR